jgi:hypothetical protein
MTTATVARPTIKISEPSRVELQRTLNASIANLGMKGGSGTTLVKVDIGDTDAPAIGWYTPGLADITFHIKEYLKLHPEMEIPDLLAYAKDLEHWLSHKSRNDDNRHDGSGGKERIRIRKELSGLLLHEGGHSQFSNWTEQGFKVSPAVVETMMIFEEGRVEKRVVDMNNSAQPKFRVKEYLRAIGRLLLANLPDKFPTAGAALGTWALVKGRTSAGTLTPAEFAPIDNSLRAHLGDDIMDDLTDIYDEAMTVNAVRDIDRLIELAKLWNEILDIGDEETSGEGGCSHKVKEKAEGEEGDGEGEGSEEEGDTDGEGSGDEEGEEEGEGEGTSGKGEGDDDGEEGDGDDGDIGDGGDSKSKGKPKTEEAEEFPDVDDLDIREVKADTSKLTEDGLASFRNSITELVESGMLDEPMMDTFDKRAAVKRIFEKDQRYDGHHWRVRKPTPHEVAASNKLASHLETMMVPTIAARKIMVEAPTGRLKSREAVRRAAERSQGRMTTAKPWVDKVRKHGMGAPAVVGIATDTSGSMSWAQDMVASAAYIVGKAGHRINAKTAAVTFGSEVEAVLKPGEVPTEVREREANGGVEELDLALAALDGALGLTTNTEAAKVLVIISDNELVKSFEPERRAMWMKKLTDAGVAIVWVDQTARGVKGAESVKIDWRSISRDGLPMVLVNEITKALDKAFTTKRGRY